MFNSLPFTPGPTVTQTTAATNTTTPLPIPAGAGTMPRQVRIASLSANPIAFIKFGNSGVVATVADTPILPGATEVFTVSPDTTHVAAIGGVGTMYYTIGFGQ